MNAICLRGSAADVKHVYHRAAQLGAWRIADGLLTAEVRAQDAVRVSQVPLTLVVRRPNGAVWTWPLSEVRTDGTQLTAMVHEGEAVA